jgi:hypothetical protein
MHPLAPAIAAAFAATLAAPAAAETLYKLIDRKGKVTYVQERPKDFDGEVIAIEIDPKANTATLPKFTPRAEPAPARPAAPAKTHEERVAQARARVEAAQKALANARDNPGEGDIQRLGIVGGGTRPVLSPEYEKRLADLERDVKEAEEALRKLERGR